MLSHHSKLRSSVGTAPPSPASSGKSGCSPSPGSRSGCPAPAPGSAPSCRTRLAARTSATYWARLGLPRWSQKPLRRSWSLCSKAAVPSTSSKGPRPPSTHSGWYHWQVCVLAALRTRTLRCSMLPRQEDAVQVQACRVVLDSANHLVTRSPVRWPARCPLLASWASMSTFPLRSGNAGLCQVALQACRVPQPPSWKDAPATARLRKRHQGKEPKWKPTPQRTKPPPPSHARQPLSSSRACAARYGTGTP